MMDVSATLAEPITVVFAHLAAPPYLGTWLPAVAGAAVDGAWQPGVGAELALTLHDGGTGSAVAGEMVAYEPPWQVAYRLWVGSRVHVLRLTCTAHVDGTRVQVHQGEGGGAPLAIDLAGLARAVASGAAAAGGVGAGSPEAGAAGAAAPPGGGASAAGGALADGSSIADRDS